MNELEELLNNISIDIRKRNTQRSAMSIPQSDEFFEHIGRKYTLIPFTIPKLFKILVDSHKLFQFKIVEADRKERIRRIDGFIVTEGNVIKSLLEFYSDELIKEYAHEFAKRHQLEKILREFIPKINEYNNTPLGKAANIVINVMSFQSVLERHITEYGTNWQERRLKIEIEKSDPISYFLDTARDIKPAQNKSAGLKQAKKSGDKQAADHMRYSDLKKYSGKNSIEKTLVVYGVEFYTRVCFRDNQYALIQKLIEDGAIEEREDLLTIKRLLQKERVNADKDPRLQNYAYEINNLEKIVNIKLK